jgi:hypothetical protein
LPLQSLSSMVEIFRILKMLHSDRKNWTGLERLRLGEYKTAYLAFMSVAPNKLQYLPLVSLSSMVQYLQVWLGA